VGGNRCDRASLFDHVSCGARNLKPWPHSDQRENRPSECGISRAMAKKAEAVVLDVGGLEVAISTPTKVYFPEAGITKLDVVQYCLAVAEGAVVRENSSRAEV
jgi:hypothetical protein